jgi:hypothetical protein
MVTVGGTGRVMDQHRAAAAGATGGGNVVTAGDQYEMSILVSVGQHLLRGSRRDAVGYLDAAARAAKPRAAEELARRKLQRRGALSYPLTSYAGTFAQVRVPGHR